MTGPLSLRSVTCPKSAKQFYTEVRDKTSAVGKEDTRTRAHNVGWLATVKPGRGQW